jgi:mono/diheme cytochrome c family protein
VSNFFKWVGIVAGVILGLALVALGLAYYNVEARLNKDYDISVESIPIPASVSKNEGEWPLALLGFCYDCHGENLAGQVMSDDSIGLLASSNLTAGESGVGSWYTDADWVRALRHGVRPNGKPLLVMPAHVFSKLNADDLGEIIAYVKSVPPVDNEMPHSELRLMGRVMLVAGMIPPADAIPAEEIDHDAPIPPKIPPSVTVEHGEYIASMVCAVCHGEDLAGGMLEGEGVNLTPAGDLANWTEEDFIQLMRTGVTPDGDELDPELMPYEDFKFFGDDQLKAIWLYLQTLPPVETPQGVEQ